MLMFVHSAPLAVYTRSHYCALPLSHFSFFFFFTDPPTTEIYTLSLHDALPILLHLHPNVGRRLWRGAWRWLIERSEEHTSELQSPYDLVCRLLLEKKKKNSSPHTADYSFSAADVLSPVVLSHRTLRLNAIQCLL